MKADRIHGYNTQAGMMHGFFPVEFPYTIGTDLAGTVEQVGSDVTGWRAGDHVVARTDPTRGGAVAELAVVPATYFAKAPASASAGGVSLRDTRRAPRPPGRLCRRLPFRPALKNS